MPHTHRARELRHALTEGERALWRVLRDRRLEGHKFRRQRPVGRYIVDFVCLERALVVEVDGAQHAEQGAYDRVRDEYLRGARFGVLRFTNREVLTEIDGVIEAILDALRAGDRNGPHPIPLPEPGEGVRGGSDSDSDSPLPLRERGRG